MKTWKYVVLMVLLAAMVFGLLVAVTGCTEAERVSHNVSQQANSFNVTRRVVVMNTRTDKIWLEVVGLLSIQIDSDGDLNLIIEVADGQYKKHIVGMNSWMTYVCEDVSGAYADKFHWEINYQPESIVPVKFKTVD